MGQFGHFKNFAKIDWVNLPQGTGLPAALALLKQTSAYNYIPTTSASVIHTTLLYGGLFSVVIDPQYILIKVFVDLKGAQSDHVIKSRDLSRPIRSDF